MSQTTCGPTDTPTDIDIDALREKYRVEREKRLRAEGSKQYVETRDQFAQFGEVDPHTPYVERDSLDIDIDVAVLGGGFAGLLVGASLKKAGVEDVHIIEMGGDFGGVWYWNRYPGIQCDNESYCYIPLLEELGFMPSKKFADGAEIFQHCRNIGKHFGLYDGAIFSTQVRDMRWEDDLKRWRISTNRGDDIRARFVVMASGSFNRPKLPGIPGIKDFGGHIFHSSRWDYSYTGGDTTGNLHKLHDKKVALIGTGATGVQLVPYLGRDAQHLYVFQRTPSTVDERNNTPTDPEWVKTLQPGWQKERQRNFHAWTFEGMALGQPDLVCDFWTELGRNTAARVMALEDPASMTPEQFMAIREEEDYKVMERLRRRVDQLVKDPQTPRRSSRTTASCANGRAPTTSTCPRSTGPTSRWSTYRKPKASNASPRPASSPTATSTRSTASSSPAGSRSPPRSAGASRSTPSRAATASRCTTTGPTATRRCTAWPAEGSPTSSSPGSPRWASRPTSRRTTNCRASTSRT